MTLETMPYIQAQLIINGETIDVMVQTVTTRIEETPIEHVYKTTDSNGKIFYESYTSGKNIQTITTYECIKIENEEVF